MKDTNLRGVRGLTKERLKACKAKGAIIDEDSECARGQDDYSVILEHYEEVRDYAGAAYVSKTMGEVQQSYNKWDEALECYHKALLYYKVLQSQEAAELYQQKKDSPRDLAGAYAGAAYVSKTMGEVQQSYN